MRAGVALLGFCLISPVVLCAPERSLHDQYEALNALRVDPSTTYHIDPANRIELRRPDFQLSLDEGQFAFFAPLDGRVTGAVFYGRGHVLALPRGVGEKQQTARFLGAPVLDQSFTYACLRFTDNTSDELLHQLQAAQLAPKHDSDFAAHWDSLLATTNPGASLRILFESTTKHPKPYFYAGLDGIASGPFDILLDLQRTESLLLGQTRKTPAGTFYDVWASYHLPGTPRPVPDFRAIHYAIDSSVLPDNSLKGAADIRIRAQAGENRLIGFELSRFLTLDEVTGEHGESLPFFQNEGLTPLERAERGNDHVYIVLPEFPAPGSEFTIHCRYHGNVIRDAGHGVLFVAARESWYPRLGGDADFAGYDLQMRWPRHLRLVATGIKSGEREDGDFRAAQWHTEKPISVAGFNLGEYMSVSIAEGSHAIDVYANPQLEESLRSRLSSSPASDLESVATTPFGMPSATHPMAMELPPPSPADALNGLARQIDSSVRFFENLSSPFPFQRLSVSQIPGAFGQGWPGLLYLSTLSYLPPEVQQRAGLSASAQEHFTDLVPYHEVAHQWWGNIVGWNDYRDQWIDEGMANYLSLMFANSQKNGDHTLRLWLERYRKSLVEKGPDGGDPPAQIGALDLGNRLNSSKSPSGFEQVIYAKGSWVIHMLREMLRQPGSKDPDAKFVALLRTLASKYAYRALTTDDLQREVQAVMTPAMDLEGGRSMEWFFEQWVRGTGIPHYRVEFTSRRTEKGYLVRGKLFQQNVPASFIAPVPLFARGAAGRSAPLGVVVADGPETSFHFTTELPPAKIAIDPQMTLLCTSE